MAFNFNGTNQYLSNNSSPLGNSPATLTIALNVKGSPSAFGTILALSKAGNNTPLVLLRVDSPSSSLAFFYRDDSNVTRYLPVYSGFFPAANFKHAAVVVDNTSACIYANGVPGTAFSKVGSFQTSLDQFSIGALTRTPVVSYFAGDIAEVGIWNVALTADEIASLAKGTTCDQIRPQSLVFYAPLVRDLIDVKGGLALTNNNGATVSNHPRVYA